MIKIQKPKKAPIILLEAGKAKRRSLCAKYNRSSKDYDAGIKKFDFDSKIYGHKTVKTALIKAQYGKCCFCESKIRHISYGDVEHFRPKAGYRQKPENKLRRPGYYWLAYEWKNLLLACQICNQRFKKNLFPLLNPSKRAKTHSDNCNKEKPFFINPAEEDPERHISFRKEIPYAVNGSRKGKTTIENLGLDRAELNEIRFDRYEKLRFLFKVAQMDLLPESNEAKALLSKAVQDSSEFAGMARAAFALKFSI